jgi:ribosomal protein S18 acetylase RimI-like enzyme
MIYLKKGWKTMDFVIKENVFLADLEKIFEENQERNVFDKTCLIDDSFLKFVCLFNNIPVGYIAIYPYSNFMEKEGIAAKFEVEKNAVYIWHFAVKKAFEGKGVASLLMDYTVKKFAGRPVYSVMEEMNTPAILIHSRVGFKPFAKFKKRYHDTPVNLLLMKKTK